MKSLYTLFIGLFIANVCLSQPRITEVFFPKYIQGVGTGVAADDRKVPYVCRLTVSGLLADSTYRYFNRFNWDSNNASTAGGEGIPILVSSNGTLTRLTSSPSFGLANRYGTFKADATGSYTGWFMIEPTSSAQFFAPGKVLYFRLMLNNPVNPTAIGHRLNIVNSVIVKNFGNTPGTGTAIRSTAVTGGAAKNFVFLWDNPNGTGRPEAGSNIEADGVANTTANGYAPFYGTDVNDVDKTWGTIIPNNLANGIQKIGQYNFADGSEVGYKISTDGNWPVVGGARISTANTTGGLTNIIVLDGAIARLDGANVKTDQTITFSGITAKTYGDADFNPGATSSTGLPIVYESSNTAAADIVSNQVHIAGAGTADITAKQAGDDFYNAAPNATHPLTITKALLIVTAIDQQIQQGDPIPSLPVSYNGFKNGDDAADLTQQPTATTSATQGSGAGQYEIIPDNGIAANYTFQYTKGWLTIVPSKQPQTISFAQIPDKTYGDPAFDPGAIATSGLTIEYVSSNTAVADTANGKLVIKGVGVTTITAKQGGNGGWLAAPDVTTTLKVNKAVLTITADNQTRKYGQPNPALTVSYSGFVYGETAAVLTTQPTVNTAAGGSSLPGDYDIDVTGATADNYTINFVKGKLTVEALNAQTVSFTALAAKKYGDADFTISATASSGLQVAFSSSNPAVATIQNNLVHIVGAGNTTITASQAGNLQYGPASTSQALTIQKARLVIQATDVTKNEGQPVPALHVTYSGFVLNEDSTVLTSLPVAATVATASSVAGAYPITVQGAAAANYAIAQLNGILTVLPAQGDAQDNVLAYVNSPGQLQVNVYAVTAGKGVVQVFDQNGTRLVNMNVALGKGYNTFRLPVGNVTPGIYHVRVAFGGTILKSKVIIQ